MGDLLDVVTGDAPSNIKLADSFLARPIAKQGNVGLIGLPEGFLCAAALQGQVRGPDREKLHGGGFLMSETLELAEIKEILGRIEKLLEARLPAPAEDDEGVQGAH